MILILLPYPCDTIGAYIYSCLLPAVDLLRVWTLTHHPPRLLLAVFSPPLLYARSGPSWLCVPVDCVRVRVGEERHVSQFRHRSRAACLSAWLSPCFEMPN